MAAGEFCFAEVKISQKTAFCICWGEIYEQALIGNSE